MADAAMRYWCAVIQFPDKKPIMFGTTTARHGAPMNEVEAEMSGAIGEHLPDGWRLINLVPGAIFFVPEGDDV